MNNLWLIVKREYLSRVTKKTFILATILTPLGIALIGFLAGYFAATSGDVAKKVAVVDQNKAIKIDELKGSTSLVYELVDTDIADLKETYAEKGYDIVLNIPRITDTSINDIDVTFLSKEKLSFVTIEQIESSLNKIIRSYKIEQSGIDRTIYDNLKTNTTLENALAGTEEEGSGDTSSKASIAIATGLSYFMGFLMYMVIFIYGGFVMRSVMEEKINRIVEVMISTVRPFELMMGKIIGVGLVGLTQLGIWLILIPLLLFAVTSFLGVDAMPSSDTQQVLDQLKANGGEEKIAEFLTELKAINWAKIIPVFIIYFLGGYFIYSSLFAAIGSAIGDDLGEGQQMMLPITLPVILSFIMIPSIYNNPNGNLAIFGSTFPLFSPILMPARLPFDPPMWQIILSIVVLLASIVFFAWLAARIYRIGILMYGKKMSFKEIGKWIWQQ